MMNQKSTKNAIELLKSGKCLTAAEEYIVFHYYKTHATLEIRNQIALNNMGLVRSVINNYTYSGIPAEELEQEGFCGLLKAIDKYDCDRGFKFSTYSIHWIKQAMGRYVMNTGRTIRIPVHASEKYRMIYKCIELYKNKYGEEPTIEYIVKETGLSQEIVKKLRRQFSDYTCLSLNQEIHLEDSHSRTELEDIIPDTQTFSADTANFEQDMKVMIKIIKKMLTEKEFHVLDMRFGLTEGKIYTLEEVGNVYGCTRERIRQIEKTAISKLQSPENMKKLQEFKDYIF